jgi:hypothetical protein
MLHVGLITKTGEIIGKDCLTRAEADNFILELNERVGVKRADIHNIETNEREKVEF